MKKEQQQQYVLLEYNLVSWYFVPNQPQRITSGLKTMFNLFPIILPSMQVIKPQIIRKPTKSVLTQMNRKHTKKTQKQIKWKLISRKLNTNPISSRDESNEVTHTHSLSLSYTHTHPQTQKHRHRHRHTHTQRRARARSRVRLSLLIILSRRIGVGVIQLQMCQLGFRRGLYILHGSFLGEKKTASTVTGHSNQNIG